jgi:hypothetical protein
LRRKCFVKLAPGYNAFSSHSLNIKKFTSDVEAIKKGFFLSPLDN